MVRLQSKLLLFIMSGAFLLMSCTNSGTDPNNGGESGDGGSGEPPEETADPTASVNNPNEGAMLEGEITFIIEGESENGFDEARIYLGQELVETISDPALPYEKTIYTREYANGDYDLRAELDIADPDTTISAGVSVTLENYMVELETNGYIEALKKDYDAVYMFISDPEGNVLRETELTAHSDGVMKLLPPEELASGAPEWYDITVAQKTTDSQGRDALYLSTDTKLKPWTRLHKEGILPKDPGPKRDLTVEMSNFDQTPSYTAFQSTEYIDSENIFYWDAYAYGHGDPLTKTFEVAKNSTDLVITHVPETSGTSNPTPVYRWEDDLKSLTGTVSYDVSQDFIPMVDHTVGVPSNVEVNTYAYFMTIAPNSFDKGDVNFAYWQTSDVVDANSSNSKFDIWVPQISSRSFITYFDGVDKNDSNIRYRYQSSIGDFPNQFKMNSGKYEVNNPTMDNVSLSYSGSGSADFGRLVVESSSSSHHHRWQLKFGKPDSYVFPKIADSLDSSIANYSRSSFEFTTVGTSKLGKIDGYDEYLDWQYGTTDYGEIVEFVETFVTLPSSSPKLRPRKTARESNGDRSINLDHFR